MPLRCEDVGTFYHYEAQLHQELGITVPFEDWEFSNEQADEIIARIKAAPCPFPGDCTVHNQQGE